MIAEGDFQYETIKKPHPLNKEEAERVFNGLSVQGHITMPLSKAHLGDYFGMCTDKFGINWLINCAANRG